MLKDLKYEAEALNKICLILDMQLAMKLKAMLSIG